MTQQEIDARLTAAADEEYRIFNAKIVRSQLPMWGVRAPFLQQIAKEIARDVGDFLDTYDARNYEQILLYALVLAKCKLPIQEKFAYLDKLLPRFDNWAHIDMTVGAFKQLAKHKQEFLQRYAYLVSAPEFERRFLVVFLMDYCMSEQDLPTLFALYEQAQCDAYYVNMGIAWGLSVALVKFYEQTVAFMRRGTLGDWIVRKTVQKARESYRITPERKEELKQIFV